MLPCDALIELDGWLAATARALAGTEWEDARQAMSLAILQQAEPHQLKWFKQKARWAAKDYLRKVNRTAYRMR